MNSSKSLSLGIQTQLHFPSNTHNLISHHTSFSFHNKIRVISNNPRIKKLRTSSNILAKATSAATNTFYTVETEETLYDLLGISESCTLSDIKQAYRQMALKYHPDVSLCDQVDKYTERFIKVQEAYETLSDPESRAMYDGSISTGLHLAFSGSRFEVRSQEKARWKESWQAQLAELKRSKVDEVKKMSWAARVRKQHIESSGSDPEQYGSV
uniref:chaperone protein dnaJ 20, chloroplastic-like n=1 Tax=Erigeron canadensis TaxID=72917 RepID=UPI001CB903FD|nr:chaperone protein dnaJ 20, chloroplastic-like [Erigeron canadensis]